MATGPRSLEGLGRDRAEVARGRDRDRAKVAGGLEGSRGPRSLEDLGATGRGRDRPKNRIAWQVLLYCSTGVVALFSRCIARQVLLHCPTGCRIAQQLYYSAGILILVDMCCFGRQVLLVRIVALVDRCCCIAQWACSTGVVVVPARCVALVNRCCLHCSTGVVV